MTRPAPTIVLLALLALATAAVAQDGPPDRDGLRRPDGRGFAGPNPMNREDIELVEAHDRDGNGWLDAAERAEAREALTALRAERGRERRGPGGRGPRTLNREPGTPGPRVSPTDVDTYPNATLYDTDTLRTIFLDFENEDWEAELQDFHGTDVEVPATMIVDGRSYPGVGVHFRGASSYMMVPAGSKRSLNVSLDFIDDEQRLYGYKTLNLLNCNGDASMMSTVLYAQLADRRLAVPKANFVKVVINGEYWGVYVNVQQFDKVFTAENFGSSKGTRWKVPGSPRGDAGLAYLGEDLEPYQDRYDMKSNDGRKAWNALIELCRVLSETPTDRLVEELSPILDIDEALWFLAYDVALVNSDGYWTRASDYSLFRDADGRFHLIPHDMNEAFQTGHRPGPGGFGGPPPGMRGQRDGAGGGRRGGEWGGRGGGPMHGGVDLDPLISIDNERMPLRSRLLAVPALRERYLEHVRDIARDQLSWNRLGPQVAQYRALIEDAVRQDTRKLDSYESFLAATATGRGAAQDDDRSLQSFARQRRAHLLSYRAPIEN